MSASRLQMMDGPFRPFGPERIPLYLMPHLAMPPDYGCAWLRAYVAAHMHASHAHTCAHMHASHAHCMAARIMAAPQSTV